MSRPKPDLAARAAWQRWEMDSLETLKPRAGAREPEPGAADWLRQRAEALSRAREQGHSKGYEAGFEQGRREGRAEGLARGLEEGRRAGEREGRALGLRAGHDEGAEAAREQVRRLQALADSCARALETLEDEVGQALISLAVRIAEQVMRTSLRDHPSQILELVDEVLRTRPAQDSALQLRLHPEDVELLGTFLEQDPEGARPRLVADERITRGGCVLETAQGAIDATLETRWRRVIAALGQAPGKP